MVENIVAIDVTRFDSRLMHFPPFLNPHRGPGNDQSVTQTSAVLHSRAAGHADASLPKRSRGGLKIHCRQLRVGSNPTAGTLDGRPVRRTAGVPLAPSGVVLCPLRLWLRQFEASATRLAGRCKPGSVPVCVCALVHSLFSVAVLAATPPSNARPA